MAPKVIVCCFAAARWAPVIFVAAIVAWSYYAYVVQMCLFTVSSIPEKVVYLIFFHPLLFLFAWSYWKIIFTEVNVVPREFFLPSVVLDEYMKATNDDARNEVLIRFGANLPVVCRTITGAPRYCDRCTAVKPDRAHHCSVCERCILKMDHHCPWVNNCVGHTNYKFFILFLFYALVYCIFVGLTSLQYFIRFWTGINGNMMGGDMQGLHIVFLFFASIMFAVSVVALFGYHCVLVVNNRSTLEAFRAPQFSTGPNKDGFNLGTYRNFTEVFGENKKLWLLPVYSSPGDGIVFPTRFVPNIHQSYLSMDSTQPPSEGSGVTYPVRSVRDDSDRLLGRSQHWPEEGESDNTAILNPV